MIRKTLLIVATILVVIISYFYVKSLNEQDSQEIISDLKSLSCDLNLSPCEIIFKGKSIKFELNPKPIFSMKPVVFDVYGLENFGFDDPSLQFYGLNMDMGKIKAKLEKKDDRYSSKIVISSCVLDIMRYRFEILNNSKPTGIFIDFDLKF